MGRLICSLMKVSENRLGPEGLISFCVKVSGFIHEYLTFSLKRHMNRQNFLGKWCFRLPLHWIVTSPSLNDLFVVSQNDQLSLRISTDQHHPQFYLYSMLWHSFPSFPKFQLPTYIPNGLFLFYECPGGFSVNKICR